MLRSVARLLVVVMLVSCGRLLACGWECSDELATPTEASCHQDSTPVTAVSGEAAHACLPAAIDVLVTVARPATAQSLTAAALVTVFVKHDRLADLAFSKIPFVRVRFPSPHSPAPSVLRI